MATAAIEYLGELRTKCRHLKSGKEFITDAPTDNNGKGEAFSPTDIVATAYVSCMLTIIGIYCDKNDLEFLQGRGEVVKSMEATSGTCKVEGAYLRAKVTHRIEKNNSLREYYAWTQPVFTDGR